MWERTDVGMGSAKHHRQVSPSGASATVMEFVSAINVNPVWLARGFYLCCTVAIVTARKTPFLHKHYLAYGARLQTRSFNSDTQQVRRGLLDALKWFARAVAIDVPHSWFTHFYIVSIATTVFWLLALSKWHVADMVTVLSSHDKIRVQSPESVTLCLLLMLLQGIRRFYECRWLLKPSSSTMWIGHYAFGLTFYLVTNVAVWIEGFSHSRAHEPLHDVLVTAWPRHAQVGMIVFAVASVAQHLAHRRLAQLKKYSVPHGILFYRLVAPHYTAECLIYAGIALVAAPDGQIFNRTVACAVLLTTINLGITAEGTKEWLLSKFQEDRRTIADRYCLIPGVW